MQVQYSNRTDYEEKVKGDCWGMADHEIPLKFTDVMTTQEAAARWKKSPVSVKHLCTGIQGRPPRLTAEECRKSGGIWLVTRAGMERLYGKEIDL